MTNYKLNTGDVVKFCKEYDGPLFHAVLTDPPYHLTSINERFGKKNSKPAKHGRDGAFGRVSKGFMGQCLSADTDILTEDGWMNIVNLVESKYTGKVYSLDMTTRCIEMTSIVDYQKFEYDDDLFHFDGRSVDLLVTPNHKMVVCDQNSPKLRLIRADSISKNIVRMVNQGDWSGDKPDHIAIGDEQYSAAMFMRFLGIYLGDGCVVDRSSQPHKQNFIAVGAAKERKQDHIRMVCEELGLKYSQYDKQTFIYDKNLNEFLLPLGHAHEKYIPNWIFSLDKSLLLELWKGLASTDGHTNGDGYSPGCYTIMQYYTSSSRLADDVQRLLLLVGLSGTLRSDKPIREDREIYGRKVTSSKQPYVISVLQPDKTIWYEQIDHKSGKHNTRLEHYSGYVYDITVDRHHTLMTRRNGRMVWSGNSWDGGDVAFQPETWQAISTVMHPGAFGMASSGSRGYHRMAVAIENSLVGNTTDSIVMPRRDLLNVSRLLELAIASEDWDLVVEAKDFIDHLYRLKTSISQAGFIIHPFVCWTYMNGFPKGTRIDTQIDEAAGIEIDRGYSFNYKGGQGHPEANQWTDRPSAHHEPQTDMAKVWTDHRYGLQALKPAGELYCVFQKAYPSNMKTYQSIVKTGAGALNIGAGWVENGGGAWTVNRVAHHNRDGSVFQESGYQDFVASGDGGRWPPNLILDESYVEWAKVPPEKLVNFFVTDWMLDRIEDTDPIVFAAKASISEREAGLDPMQRRLMREMYAADYELDALDRIGVGYGEYYGKNKPFKDEIKLGVNNDGRRAVSDRPYLRNTIERYNTHPTIKPLSLCEYLARLLSAPDHYAEQGRRLFVPFSGAGSEACGAVISGKWEEVVGCELMEKHNQIAEVRLNYWIQMREKYGDRTLEMVKLSMKSRKKSKTSEHEQAEMF